LNYLYAKKHGGQFILRLDRLSLDEREKQYQQNIETDLRAFGLVPDRVLRSSERLPEYMKAVEDLVKHERSYHCDCTVQDLLKRACIDDKKFRHLYRPEKYPPYCQISLIQVYGIDNEDPIQGCGVYASMEAKDHPARCLVGPQPRKGHWWEPWDVGYIHHPSYPHIRIDLPPGQIIRAVKIIWKDRPALRYRIEHGRIPLVEVRKSDQYFVDYRQGQPFMPLQCDVHNFAPREMKSIVVTILECARPVDRPYFYDGHCRLKEKTLDLNHKDTVLRLRADERFSEYDVAYWYSREPNLVVTSVVDDAELGVTDCIRGEDIKPWLFLEGQVALALNTPPRNQRFHGLIVSSTGYKYSKWIESTPIREYGVEPDKLIAYLSNKAGIVKKPVTTLEETVKEYNGEIPAKHVVIDEYRMLEELKTNR
jgi:hypothetical protein